jgi:hypothetical protein
VSDAGTGADDLRQAYDSAAETIVSTPDPDEAFDRASALRDAADGIVGDAAVLRAQMAYRLLRAEGMSLAQLATRLGISKARADQLIRTARAIDDRRAPGSSGVVHGEDPA